MKKLVIVMILMFVALEAGDIAGTVTTKGVRDGRNVVIYLKKVEGEFQPPEKPLIMDQKDLTFIPHVLPLIMGTAVDFRNSDDVLHNVFSPDKCANKFNLGTWPKGEVRSFTFEDEGCFSVMLCNVHPEMEAWVLALQNPYFFVTDKDGAYVLKDVPAGTYKLVAWHEKLKDQEKTVVVPDGGEVAVDFALSRR